VAGRGALGGNEDLSGDSKGGVPGSRVAQSSMVMVEAAFVIGLVGVMIYGIASFLLRPQEQQHRPSSLSGTWRVAHYDTKHETRVVLQKISESGTKVLDEHVVATLRAEDAKYDDKFLTAMSIARQRQALFESEEGA
jgi:hypothetical protein